uniref:Uncharacterized protein n=1 Tax=Cucumis melo TaxID=3656 RepID=A0A9I9EKT0_CUCME
MILSPFKENSGKISWVVGLMGVLNYGDPPSQSTGPEGNLLLARELRYEAVPSLRRAPYPSFLVLESAWSKLRFVPNPGTLVAPKAFPNVPHHPNTPHINPG